MGTMFATLPFAFCRVMVSPPCCGNKEALQGGRILGSKLSAHTLSFDDIMLLHTL